MNPWYWKRQDQVGLVVMLLVGALIGIVIGFTVTVFADAMASTRSTFTSRMDLVLWPQAPILSGWWPWSLFGATISGLLFYAKRIISN